MKVPLSGQPLRGFQKLKELKGATEGFQFRGGGEGVANTCPMKTIQGFQKLKDLYFQ